MKEQPRQVPGNASDRESRLELEFEEDFFDLPSYTVHEPAQRSAQPKPLTPRRRGRIPKEAILFRLFAFSAALLFTAAVVLIAHSAIGDTPTDTDTPAENTPDTPDTPTPDTPDTDSMTPTEPTTPPIPPYTYAADVSAYADAIEQRIDKQDILLLNKQNPQPNYAPEVLTSLDKSDTLYGKEVNLEVTTAAALKAMLLCMRADGITDTFVTSGYRSYTYQSQLFAFYIQQEMSQNAALSREQATAIVERYSSRPGYSEHQSGLCVDLMTTTMGNLDESFENTEAFAWLTENAAQFGFILRYPKDKEHITGYAYEPWHYRFVGRAAALEITTAGITLEEYLGATK